MATLQDQVVRRLMRVGCADVCDLANEIEQEASPENLQKVLMELAEKGVVKRVLTPWAEMADPRQWVYALKK